MNFSKGGGDIEANTNGSILGNQNGNLTVTIETDATEVGMLATAYLIYKIGNFPLIFNITVRNTLMEVHAVLRAHLHPATATLLRHRFQI